VSREVRRVPADWAHPKYPDDYYESHRRGRYIPLWDGGFEQADAEWSEGYAKWLAGFAESYAKGQKWEPRDPKYAGMRFTEYHGPRPSPDDYMPNWPEAERTHLMMYETTSEGTPKSPAFATPEELARWCADDKVSAFADMTATYEQWLHVARGGWAPSAVVSGGVMQSGVAAMAEAPQ
jgi:hypothetical protein